MTVAMFVFGLLMIFSALGVVLARKPFTSALWLLCTFVLLGVNYALLSADFLAVMQIMIYGGAVAVLIIFVVMLLGAGTNQQDRCGSLRSLLHNFLQSNSKLRFTKEFFAEFNFRAAADWVLWVTVRGLVVLVFFLCISVSYYFAHDKLPDMPLVETQNLASLHGNISASPSCVEEIGRVLFTEYAGVVKLLSVLIFTAIVGVVVLVKDKRRPLPPGHGLKAKQEPKKEEEQ